MDLETGRARWVMLLLLVCAFAACLFVFRRYEQREETGSAAGRKDDTQDAGEPVPEQEPQSGCIRMKNRYTLSCPRQQT